MEFAALGILLISNLLGFLAIFFTNFGTLIILIGAVIFAFMTEFLILDIYTLLIILGLYLIGEVLEYICIIVGAKKLGASNAAVFGALVGGIVGAVLGASGFGVGIIVGSFSGIFFGAFIVEMLLKRDWIQSLKAGAGSLIGRVGAIFAKVFIAIIIFGIMTARSLEHASKFSEFIQ